jgi:hypothetical protein
MSKEIDVIFYYDTVDTSTSTSTSTFSPKCVIFFIHDKKLYDTEILITASDLMIEGYYSISTYLGLDFINDYIYEIIIENKSETHINSINDIPNSNPDFIDIKKKMIGILRKQKISVLLN